MNWDMIGAVGETVGALAVVLTLGYLARQVRESAKQSQRQQSAATQQHFASLLNLIVADDRLPSIFMAGLRDYSSLNEEQKIRFGAWMLNALRAGEQLFHLERERGILGYQAGSLTPTLREAMLSPGARTYWKARREWFSSEWQREVDSWMAEGGRDLVSRHANSGSDGSGRDNPVAGTT